MKATTSPPSSIEQPDDGSRQLEVVLSNYSLRKFNEDNALSEIIGLFAGQMNFPMAHVSVITAEEQFFKARSGFDLDCTPRADAFCAHVVDNNRPLVVEDASRHELFSENPYVSGEPGIRFYAGVPLRLDSVTVGAVAVMDSRPREMAGRDIEWLEAISRYVTRYLELLQGHAENNEERMMLNESRAVILRWVPATGLRLGYLSENAENLFGLPRDKLVSGEALLGDYLDGPGRDELNFVLSNHSKGMDAYQTHLKLLSPTGERYWIKVHSKAFFDHHNRLNSINMMLIDDTQSSYLAKKISETNRQMKLLLEASELGTWDVNLPADINQVNGRWCEMLGLEHDAFDPSIHFWRTLVHPADRGRVEKDLQDHLAGRNPKYNTVFRMQHTDGHWVWIETYGKIVERNERGEPVRIAGTHRDVTQRIQKELAEKKQSQLLGFVNKAQTAYLANGNLSLACREILPELIDLADGYLGFIGQLVESPKGRRIRIRAVSDLSWSERHETLVNRYESDDLFLNDLSSVFGRAVETAQPVLINDPESPQLARELLPGLPRIFRFMGLPITLGERVVGVIGVANGYEDYQAHDARFLEPLLNALAQLFYAVTLEEERQAMEQRLKSLAMTDPLTNIPNRRAFFEQMEVFHQRNRHYVVALLDIDHFKRINDTYGHPSGDAVIREVAGEIRRTLRTDDVVGRVGGEEFALLLTSDTLEGGEQLLQKLRQALANRTISTEGHMIELTVSIGAYLVEASSLEGLDGKRCLARADKALYRAKNSGRNRVCWYSSDSEPSRSGDELSA